MKKMLKPVVAVAVVAVYLILLRYVAPSNQPYHVLGTAVVGMVAWLCGSVMGLAVALLLVPATSWIYSHFSVATSYESFAYAPAYIALQILAAVSLGSLKRITHALNKKDTELAAANERLRDMLANVQELGGIHNLCSQCKSIQDKDGTWQHVDQYLKEQTKMEFSHCICPDCAVAFEEQIDADPA
jgi:hypothetical protein